MRRWTINEQFGIDHLVLGEAPGRSLEPLEVRLRLRAVALNYRDRLMVEGAYDPRQPLPLVPCSDGAGEVVEVGAEVTDVAVGDRAMPIFAQDWLGGEPTRDRLRSTLGGPVDGTLSEEMVLPAGGLVRAPGHMTDVEASTLACAGVTAWSALVTHGHVKAGDIVLVLGTGGVALFALQIAGWLGARVIVTSSNDSKLARARELGAWKTVNYRETPSWGTRVRELSGGRGVDHVVELGGAGTLDQSVRACRLGGTISLIGNVAGGRGTVDVVPMFMNRLRLHGILVGSRDELVAFGRAAEAHRLRPVIDRTVPFERAPEAFRRLSDGEHFGKIVIAL